MRGMRITTERGSTYLVGPGAGGRVRVARVSDHPVRGTLGPFAFAEDFTRVELVTTTDGVCLECTGADGQRFRTSAVAQVAAEDLATPLELTGRR